MAATTRTRAAKKAAPTRKPVRKADEDTLELPDDSVSSPGQPQVAYFEIERETPGTVRFKEEYDDRKGQLPVSKTVYVLKTAWREMGEPTRIKVTYDPVDDL